MTRHDFIHKRLPLIGLVLSLVIFIISLTNNSGSASLRETAEKTGKRTAERIEALNEAIENTLSLGAEEAEPEEIDKDLVVYRYVNDSLVFWNNQFPILNDDISRKMVFHRLSPMDSRIESPLGDVTGEFSYMNIGTKWYLIKYVDGVWNDRVIAGLEIKSTLEEESDVAENGINPELNLNASYSIQPLSYNGGIAVSIDGNPAFKIIHDDYTVIILRISEHFCL